MRHLVISSDCHAGLPPERYRDYLDPKYRARFDAEIAAQIAQRKQAAKLFLVDEFAQNNLLDIFKLLRKVAVYEHLKVRAIRRVRGKIPSTKNCQRSRYLHFLLL